LLHNQPIEKFSVDNKYEMLSTEGIVLVADVKMQEAIEKKNDFVGRLYYNFSVLYQLS
jgi:hypothetical protein